MVSSSKSVVMDIIDPDSVCQICLLSYDNNKINLKCGSKVKHYMCKKCFQSMQSDKLLCPWCRNKINYRDYKIIIKKYLTRGFIYFLYLIPIIVVFSVFTYIILHMLGIKI